MLVTRGDKLFLFRPAATLTISSRSPLFIEIRKKRKYWNILDLNFLKKKKKKKIPLKQ